MGFNESKEIPSTAKDFNVKAKRRSHVKRNKIPLLPTTTDKTIPSFMTPYIRNIENTIGDGNCGFRAVALATGKSEHDWPAIRKELLVQLYAEFDYYMSIYLFKDCISEVSESLQWDSGASYDKKHHMQMPVTAYILADTYKRPCVLFTQTGNHTCMPMYPPSEYSEENRPIVLLLDLPSKKGYYSGHYKSVEVTDDCILPPVLPQINTPFVEQWKSLFSQQLQSYCEKAVTAGTDSSEAEISLSEDEASSVASAATADSGLFLRIDKNKRNTSSIIVHADEADNKVTSDQAVTSTATDESEHEKLVKGESTPTGTNSKINLDGKSTSAKRLSRHAKLIKAAMRRLSKKITKAFGDAIKPTPTVNFHFGQSDEDLHRFYRNNKCSLTYFIIVISGM